MIDAPEHWPQKLSTTSSFVFALYLEVMLLELTLTTSFLASRAELCFMRLPSTAIGS